MNNTFARKKSVIDKVQLAKWSACLYVVVSKALVPLGFLNGVIQLAMLFLTVLLTLFMDHGKPKMNSFLIIELSFIVLSTFTSVLVAKNQSLVNSSVQTLLYSFLFGYCLIRISLEERTADWFIKSFVFAGVVLIGYIFLTGGYSSGKLARITAREDMNVNTLGVFLLFSIWGTLHLLSVSIREKTRLLQKVVVGIAAIAAFMYIIFGTGSRKAFIASLFVIAFWILFAMVPTVKQISLQKRAFVFVIALAIIVFIYYRFGGMFSSISETMNYRMRRLSNENITDMHRFNLIRDALKVFINNPFLGVGWNNYRLYSFSSQYSHCTYVEVLACTGILGSIPAYWLWGIMFKNSIWLLRNSLNRSIKVNIISLLAVLLFIDATQIMYYNTTLLMIMHLLVVIPLVQKKLMNEEPIRG